MAKNKNQNSPFSSFKNSAKEIGSNGKQLGTTIIDAIKTIPKLPWKKLPKERVLALIIMALSLILLFVFYLFFLS